MANGEHIDNQSISTSTDASTTSDSSEDAANLAKAQARRPKNRPRGWGGPAKGAHPAKPRRAFARGGTPGPGQGHFSKEGELRAERQARHAEEMRAILYGLASDPATEDTTRLQAADKLLDRIEGKPLQRVYAAESDPIALMTDAELEAEIFRQRDRISTYDRARLALAPAPPENVGDIQPPA